MEGIRREEDLVGFLAELAGGAREREPGLHRDDVGAPLEWEEVGVDGCGLCEEEGEDDVAHFAREGEKLALRLAYRGGGEQGGGFGGVDWSQGCEIRCAY